MHYGKTYKSTARHMAVKHVVCEKCGAGFRYRMERRGEGWGSALLGLGCAGAMDRAERAAQRQAERRAEREVELTPCPSCNWVNESTVAQYRRQVWRRPWRRALLSAAVGFFIAFAVTRMIVEAGWFSVDTTTSILYGGFALGVLAGPIIFFFIRHHLRMRIDPNATHPQEPALPRGTPRAVVELLDEAAGVMQHVEVPHRGGTLGRWSQAKP